MLKIKQIFTYINQSFKFITTKYYYILINKYQSLNTNTLILSILLSLQIYALKF